MSQYYANYENMLAECKGNHGEAVRRLMQNRVITRAEGTELLRRGEREAARSRIDDNFAPDNRAPWNTDRTGYKGHPGYGAKPKDPKPAPAKARDDSPVTVQTPPGQAIVVNGEIHYEGKVYHPGVIDFDKPRPLAVCKMVAGMVKGERPLPVTGGYVSGLELRSCWRSYHGQDYSDYGGDWSGFPRLTRAECEMLDAAEKPAEAPKPDGKRLVAWWRSGDWFKGLAPYEHGVSHPSFNCSGGKLAFRKQYPDYLCFTHDTPQARKDMEAAGWRAVCVVAPSDVPNGASFAVDDGGDFVETASAANMHILIAGPKRPLYARTIEDALAVDWSKAGV